jgi:hypothetical protein
MAWFDEETTLMDSNMLWFDDVQWGKLFRIYQQTNPAPSGRMIAVFLAGSCTS